MSHITLTLRLGHLEQSRGENVPLYLRRWMGQPLSPEQHEIADVEWACVSQIPPDTSKFSPEGQAWLRERGPAA